VTNLTLAELRAKIDSGEPVVLVEALPEWKYRSAHLPGALHLEFDHPDTQRLDRVLADARELLPDRDADIVVYCAGNR
jgi:rhodanese-related sulfurtransferase